MEKREKTKKNSKLVESSEFSNNFHSPLKIKSNSSEFRRIDIYF
jgi:hypothetical protein